MKIRPRLFWLAFAAILAIFADVLDFASASDLAAVPNHPGQPLWKANSAPCPLTRPVISGGMLFVGACDGKFYALDKRSGRVIWSHDARSEGALGNFETTPLLRRGLAIAGTSGECTTNGRGNLYAFDQQTGSVRWKMRASADSNIFVDMDGGSTTGSIIFGTRDGELLSLEANAGSVNWKVAAASPGSTCEHSISVATDGVSVCVHSKDGNITCLDANSGHKLWMQKFPSSVKTDVLMYKDVLYFGGTDSYIYGLNPETGKNLVRLKVPYAPEGGLAESDKDTQGEFEFAYGKDGNDALIGFSDEFDRVLWTRPSTEPWSSSEPAVWKNTVVAGNCRGDIVGYRVIDGEPQWRTRVHGCVDKIASDDSILYIVVREGAIYTYQPQGQKRRK